MGVVVVVVVVWLKGKEVGEAVGLGWWWLGWGGRMGEGKGLGILFFFS